MTFFETSRFLQPARQVSGVVQPQKGPMSDLPKVEQLLSGKTIVRQFNDDGTLAMELHTHGNLAIGIQFDFVEEAKVGETYFVKRRLVGRHTYEKARTTYSDMPAADGSQEDTGAELLRAVAKERKQRQLALKRHEPNADEARKLDAFCFAMMSEGIRQDAASWIQDKNHTLGERDWRSSKRLVERLSELGCVHVYACRIDRYEEGMENTSHLVVELPTERDARGKVLKALGRLAARTGYHGAFDDGQRYAYGKLD
jgi:hypothetical protein